MHLKKTLLSKVSEKNKNEFYFQALLDHIDQNNIQNKEHLVNFLGQETALVETWLDENKASANTKSIRDKAVHLDVLKKCSKLTGELLS
jgi:hypothetical protein